MIQGLILNISMVNSLKLLNNIIDSEISIVVLPCESVPLNISYFLVIYLYYFLSSCVFILTNRKAYIVSWSFLISICWSSSDRFWAFLIFIQYSTIQLYFWLIRNLTFIIYLKFELWQRWFFKSLWENVINSWNFINLLCPFVLFRLLNSIENNLCLGLWQLTIILYLNCIEIIFSTCSHAFSLLLQGSILLIFLDFFWY
jgi:hypothetical protein